MPSTSGSWRHLDQAVQDTPSPQPRSEVAASRGALLELLELALELFVLPRLLLEVGDHVLVRGIEALSLGELPEYQVDLEPRLCLRTLVGHPPVDGLAQVPEVAVQLQPLAVHAAL